MTRWARGSDANRKRPLEASTWGELKSAQNKSSRKTGRTEHRSAQKKTSKSKYFYKEGEWHTQSNKDDEDTDITMKIKRPDDDPKPRGIAAELEDIQKTADLSSEDEREIVKLIKKDKRREKRRTKRLQERDSSKVCYHCRESGHDMGSCPQLKQSTDQGTGVCFKCGSTEHNLQQCRIKLPPGEYPFAKCFICGEKGHLSKQCPDNPRGLYPNGGCCRMCSSVEHYKKDCPELHKKQGIQDIRLDTVTSGPSSMDAEPEQLAPKAVKKKGPKIVKF